MTTILPVGTVVVGDHSDFGGGGFLQQRYFRFRLRLDAENLPRRFWFKGLLPMPMPPPLPVKDRRGKIRRDHIPRSEPERDPVAASRLFEVQVLVDERRDVVKIQIVRLVRVIPMPQQQNVSRFEFFVPLFDAIKIEQPRFDAAGLDPVEPTTLFRRR